MEALRHPGTLALLACAVLLTSGCVAAPAQVVPTVKLPTLGETAVYTATFPDSSETVAEVRVGPEVVTRDRFDRVRQALVIDVLFRGEDERSQLQLFVARDTGQILHKGSWTGRVNDAEVHAEESPLWLAHPKPASSANHAARCLSLGAVSAPIRLLPDRPVLDEMSGVAYSVKSARSGATLIPEDPGALSFRLQSSGAFFPRKVELVRPDGEMFCSLERVGHRSGAASASIAAGREPREHPPPGPARARLSHGLPPSAGASLAFPLEEAAAAMRRDGQVRAFLSAHPDAYVVYAEYGADRPGVAPGTRGPLWVLRWADPDGPFVLGVARRATGPGGTNVDVGQFLDEGRLAFVPPRAALAMDLVELSAVLDRARTAANLTVPTTINWFVAEGPELVGTPDAAVWQVMRATESEGTKSLMVSATNGQLINRIWGDFFIPSEPDGTGWRHG